MSLPKRCRARRETFSNLAFNDLGMHRYDSDYSVFTILPPFNNYAHAAPRPGPRILTIQVSVFSTVPGRCVGIYHHQSGKVNGVPKTNF
jgi:hypothetical protein